MGGGVRACAQERGSCQGTHDPSTVLIYSTCAHNSPGVCAPGLHMAWILTSHSGSENEGLAASVDKEGAHLLFPKCLFHLGESCVLCIQKRLASFHFLAIDDLL